MWFAAGAVISMSPFPLSAAPASLPYCKGLVNNVVGPPESVWPRKLVLNGDHLRLWVERSAGGNASESWGVGYKLDGSPVMGIVPIATQDLTIIVSFLHLRRGPHHLGIGLMNPDGHLIYGNDLCFSSPGHFALTGR